MDFFSSLSSVTQHLSSKHCFGLLWVPAVIALLSIVTSFQPGILCSLPPLSQMSDFLPDSLSWCDYLTRLNFYLCWVSVTWALDWSKEICLLVLVFMTTESFWTLIHNGWNESVGLLDDIFYILNLFYLNCNALHDSNAIFCFFKSIFTLLFIFNFILFFVYLFESEA